MRVGKKIIFSLISIIVALIAIFSVYIYVSVIVFITIEQPKLIRNIRV